MHVTSEKVNDLSAASPELLQQIQKHDHDPSLVIVNKDIAVAIDHRSEWGSTGGIGYYSQVHVFCGSQSKMQEWQWRDRYRADNDKPWLSVHSIGKVDMSEKDNKVIVRVELVNRDHGSRTATYTFDPPKVTSTKLFSQDEQRVFTAKVDSEMIRVMAELNRLADCKTTMVSPHTGGYVPYRRPSIKQREIRPEIGVAVFVTEEQIDHHVSDAQIRHELYVVTAEADKAKCMAEDHGYGSEGGSFLTIVEVNQEQVVINTKRGKSTVMLAVKS